eukprot:168224_1
MINDANQMTQSRLIILLVIIMDLIHNARASIPDTRNTFGFSFSHAKKLTKYAKSAHWIDKNSTEILQHIIDTRILNSTALNKLVESDHNVTIINEPLSVVLNGLDDICHDFRDQIDIQSAKANLNATGPKAKNAYNKVVPNGLDDICHDFRDQIDIQSAKANLNATGPKAKNAYNKVVPNGLDDICHDFRDQIDIQSAKANLGVYADKIRHGDYQ